jgi:hypothetical protein
MSSVARTIERGEDMSKAVIGIAIGGLVLYVGWGVYQCYLKHHSLNPLALLICAISSSGGIIKGLGKEGLKDAKKVGQFIGKTGKNLTHGLGKKAKTSFRKIKHVF